MLVADLGQSQNCVFKEGTLVVLEMGECKGSSRDEVVHDVEEGEISDSASVEEISDVDFVIKHDSPPVLASPANPSPPLQPTPTNVNPEITNNSSKNHNPDHNNSNNNSDHTNQKPRVWTITDLYKYQISRNYRAGLSNLAWASGVQNKPLDEVLGMEYSKTATGSRVGPEGSLNNKSNINNNTDNAVVPVEVNEKVVIEVDDEEEPCVGAGLDEKEEGELEEGEIDMDSEVVDGEGNNSSKEDDLNSIVGEDAGLEKPIDSILRGLEKVTAQEAKKSFGEVCSRMHNFMDQLQHMVAENSLTKKDDLVHLSFTAIQTLNTVFCSMSQTRQEEMRGSMKRLLSNITSQKRPLFSAEQLKEIKFMVSSMDSYLVASSSKARDSNKEVEAVQEYDESGTDISLANINRYLVKSSATDSIPAKPTGQTDPGALLENLKSGASNLKYRGLSLSFLDLHKDHDADSLPSPTRETASCLPIEKGFGMGRGLLKPEWPIPRVVIERDTVPVHPYETDAVKAISSYQQKFGRSSFLMTDRLPSPTPSEDGNIGDIDANEEVSSSSNRLDHPISTTLVGQSTSSSTTNMENILGQGFNGASNASWLNSGQNPQMKPASAKSRDPRLRLANSDTATLDRLTSNETKVESVGNTISSRKQKTVEEPALNGPALKRQRNELIGLVMVSEAQAGSGNGGWLEDTGKLNENLPPATPSGPDSFQSLLKDLAVNPSMLMGLIKMGQQRSTDPTKSATQASISNATMGPVSLTNLADAKTSTSGVGSPGILQTSLKAASVEETGAIRMKPRDPRRVLHSKTLQKGGSTELEHSQAKNGSLSIVDLIGNRNDQALDNQLDRKIMPSSITPPDITRQFTKNLKNIADLISVSPAISSASAPPQILSSQPAKAVPENSKGMPDLSRLQAGTGGKEFSTGTAESQNNWDDVEHLFEGFDEQQKAAIQRERTRRLEEQRKMFAERKLCLVLDLDHTLLNSAKFAEVDTMHEEILRKKEEQDCDKPYRHLFRFPHMGMWTKLRPGIWNFLEKASKLYELHLYTMGNKLYATEMAKLLDPKGNLFADRVISRGDDGDLLDGEERVPKSKDLEGVLGMESAVVIIDDSVRVWPHHKLNLIAVERYIYFPCSRRQFGLPGPSLLEIDHDERPEDGTLASSLAVIEKIHENFFAHESLDEGDVRNILASEQRKILGGCRVVFSRVIPVGEANPHLHPLWQTAEQFGAVCTNSIDEKVTHVVANSLGTDKVNWAISTGRFVVYPGWVEASALLYRRANEHDFAIKP